MNKTNIAVVIVASLCSAGIGMYDSLVQHFSLISKLTNAAIGITTTGNPTGAMIESALPVFMNSSAAPIDIQSSLSTNAGSSINFAAMGVMVLAAIITITIVSAGLLGRAGGME